MAETLMSVVLVGGVLVAALHTAGQSTVGQSRTVDHAKGALLAQDLMTEILRQNYGDPGPNPAFGTELLEEGSTRLGFDDVDDYNGVVETTLQEKDGTSIPCTAGWMRQVDVVFADPANLDRSSVTETGIKRITVTVKHNGAEVAVLTAIRGTAGESGSGGAQSQPTQ